MPGDPRERIKKQNQETYQSSCLGALVMMIPFLCRDRRKVCRNQDEN